MSLRLNLGASNDVRPGYLSVDIAPPADVVCDLRQPWPWETSSVDEILAHDVFEHFPQAGYRLRKTWRCVEPHLAAAPRPCMGDVVLADVEIVPYSGIVHALNESWRVLRPGGKLDLVVPCYPGIAVWCDPTHASVWTSDTRYYFDERWNNPQGERGRLGPAYGITALFRTVGGRSGPDWTPIQYAADAPDRRKLFLVLECVK